MGKTIKVTMKNGDKEEFRPQGRPGGSWTNSIRYEGGFAIITDEWGKETALPSGNIKSIVVTPY